MICVGCLYKFDIMPIGFSTAILGIFALTICKKNFIPYCCLPSACLAAKCLAPLTAK